MSSHAKNEKPNYLIESVVLTAIVICIGINIFSFSTSRGIDLHKESAISERFGSFELVNVRLNNRQKP